MGANKSSHCKKASSGPLASLLVYGTIKYFSMASHVIRRGRSFTAIQAETCSGSYKLARRLERPWGSAPAITARLCFLHRGPYGITAK